MANSELNVFIYRISFRVFLLFGSPTSVLITRWLWCVTYNLSLFFFCFSTLSKWIHPNKMPTVPFFFLLLLSSQLFSFEWCHHSDTIVVHETFDSRIFFYFFLLLLYVSFFWWCYALHSVGGEAAPIGIGWNFRLCTSGLSSSFGGCWGVCGWRGGKKKKKVLLALFKCHVIVTSRVQYQSPDAQYCLDRWRTPLSPFFFLEIFFLVVVVVVVVFYPSLVYWPGRVWLTRGKPTKWARASGCVLRVRRRRHHAGITDERKRRGGRKGSRRTKPERGGGWLSLRSFSFLSF